MEIIVFESQAFYKLQAEQLLLFKQALKEAKLEAIDAMSPDADWLTLAEAKKILPYNSKTKWQELRDTGSVVFSQFGRKILYSKKSIRTYIEKNKIK